MLVQFVLMGGSPLAGEKMDFVAWVLLLVAPVFGPTLFS